MGGGIELQGIQTLARLIKSSYIIIPFVARCFRNERGELLRHLSLFHHFS